MKRRGKAYPPEFREIVLAKMREKQWTHKEAAEFFKVGEASVDRWSSLQRETGGVAARPRGGGRRRAVDAHGDRELRRLVREKPDRTIDELTALLRRRTSLKPSPSAVSRALLRLGLTLKKRRSSR